MGCFTPLRGCLVKAPGGRRFSMKSGSVGQAVTVPCGRCEGCMVDRARRWAIRIVHESELHDVSSFITLTFNDENLPNHCCLKCRNTAGLSLCVCTCQLFLKRLRERVLPAKIRFFLAGEYGSKSGRPHYHAIIFGYGFPDRVALSGNLYRSDLLESVWPFGYSSIGEVNFDSACYVANYCTKKLSDEDSAVVYAGRKPEFLLMSRRPGIGNGWIKKYGSDVFPSDEVIINGVSVRPPRYYDDVVQQEFAVEDRLAEERFSGEELSLVDRVKRGRIDKEKIVYIDTSTGEYMTRGQDSRLLAVDEKVARAKLSLKSKSL